jgi:Mlc titration factor MtfA (ptsG expression regulator)
LKVHRASDRWFVWSASAVLLSGGVVVGALAGGMAAAALGGVAGLAIAAALGWRLRRRTTRRRALVARPLPEGWRRLLTERSPHFDRLPRPLRERFERDVAIFLGEKTITGVGIEASDELRLLVAASAITLSVGWPDHEWDALTEVLLYPDDFDRDYNFGGEERVGEAHAWGTVILSAPALQESFDDPEDGYHVGFHEFAHLLDLQLGEFDGVPAALSEARSRQWAALVPQEMERIREGQSALDEYGAESPAEFFAVSVETFFELPGELRDGHPTLYEILSEYFAQDAAAWQEARPRRRRMRRRKH